MDCTFEQTNFYAYCGVLAFLDIVSFFILAIQFITVCCLLSKCKHAHIRKGKELKRAGSEAPLIYPAEAKERELEDDLRNVSFVRREVDKHAIEAIYGRTEEEQIGILTAEKAAKREIGLGEGRSRLRSRQIMAAAALYVNEAAQAGSKPVGKLEKFETDREKLRKMSQKFSGDSQIPSGLVAKPEKEEEPVEPVEQETETKPKKAKKAAPKRYKDPPSVFKGRKGRGDFLDDEFADLVDQTNRRLAEYTLAGAGVIDEEVSIFANQRITEKNIKRSKFEFNQAALNQQKPETHSRKLSDQKKMLLMAKSVYDDFDTEILGKSLDSEFSRGTDVTAVSRDNIHS